MTKNNDERCGDRVCFHALIDLCTYKREKVNYKQIACEYFIWD